MQAINAVEHDVESPRDDPSTTLGASTLHRIRLARVCDTICEQETVPSFECISHQRESRLTEEVRLRDIGRENVRECVEGSWT